jgi:hypothetical protein
MAVVGTELEAGLRIAIERPLEGGPPWEYEGEATTTEACYRLRAVVARDGEVKVEILLASRNEVSLTPVPEAVRARFPSSSSFPRFTAPANLVEGVRRIVRTAYRHARDEDPEAPPPRRIARWRAS